ncbi:MAG: methyltransferase domain-containing protein [Chloroflexi bacterium]|nr:methyltransferase domain-containing protein [Chloroflexota bacterium]
MDAEQIKLAVRSRYGQIASQGSGCGCGPGCCTPAPAALSTAAEEADLGLSCGLPLESAGVRPGEVVLDLGSGAGVDVFRAAEAAGPTGRAIGVDMTPEMVARARRIAAERGVANAEFRLGEIETLPVESASIDLVLSNCVLNLVPDKSRAFAEIYRVLKPGGRFSIADIVSAGRADGAPDMSTWADCAAGALDHQVYLDLIRRAGFEQIESGPVVQWEEEAAEEFRYLSLTVRAYKPCD